MNDEVNIIHGLDNGILCDDMQETDGGLGTA